MKHKEQYKMIRIKHEADVNVTMILHNGDRLNLRDSDPKWCDFATIVHSNDFTLLVPTALEDLFSSLNYRKYSKYF